MQNRCQRQDIFKRGELLLFSRSGRVQLSVIPRTAARQASLSITNSWSLLKLLSIESMMPSNHLIRCGPLLLLPPSFPPSGGSEHCPEGGNQQVGQLVGSLVPPPHPPHVMRIKQGSGWWVPHQSYPGGLQGTRVLHRGSGDKPAQEPLHPRRLLGGPCPREAPQ